MSGNYRVEISPNNRAGCQGTACKKENVKIMKGEVRQGVTVNINEHVSIKWRHWGCVTPTVLHNWNETAGGDMDLVDGYEELPKEIQDQVKLALEEGHVDDDEWNGDPEMNRYNPAKPTQGMFMTKADRKKKEKEEAAENGDDDAAPKKKTTKKRKTADAEDDDEGAEKPAPKKSRGKKAKTEDADDADDAPPPPKKARGKKAKTEDADDAGEAPAPKKPRAKKAKAEPVEEDEAEAAPAKKKPGRKPKAKKETVDDDEE